MILHVEASVAEGGCKNSSTVWDSLVAMT
jgi:hypothetical protein